MSAQRELAKAPERSEPQVAPAPTRSLLAGGLTPATVIALQRTAGNAAVTSLMRSHTHAETQPPLASRDMRVVVVEYMPTLPERGVTYVIGKPARRYTFEVAYAGGAMHYKNISSAESIAKLRQIHWILLDDLERARADHQKRWQYQGEHLKTSWLVDLRGGGRHMPFPAIWDKVRRGTLAEALAVINSTDEDVRAHWERERPPEDPAHRDAWAEHGYDPTQERIVRAGALLEKAGHELDACERELDQYLEHSVESALRMIRDIKITIVVLGAMAGGAGAGFAAEGAGIATQAAYSAATMGFVGAVEESAGQVGEIYYGLRDHFDVKALGKRVTRDVVLGFVGGVIGGKFSQVLKSSLGGWIKTVSDAELVAAGVTREELLNNFERLFVEWAGGSIGSSPFTTVAGTMLDQALDGKLHVQTWGDFAKSVLDKLIEDGKMGAFLTAIGRAGAKHGRVEPAVEPRRAAGSHAEPSPRRGSTGHPKPPKPPVIEESPPGGFEPTTKEPVPEDYGPAPHQEEIVLDEGTPKRETRTNNDQGFTRKHYKDAAELRKGLRKALRELRKKAAKHEKANPRQHGEPREIDLLIERIKAKNPAFAEQVRRYYAALENPRWVEEQMVRLWESARDNGRTPAQELEHLLGADKHGVNEFKNDFSNEDREAQFEDFRKRVVQNPRVFVDMQEPGSDHGAYTHAFQQYLGDCLFGRGKGLDFRVKLATIKGDGLTVRPGQEDAYVEPLWASTWDTMFDADGEGNMHAPEQLGPLLQEYLDFPRWNPGGER